MTRIKWQQIKSAKKMCWAKMWHVSFWFFPFVSLLLFSMSIWSTRIKTRAKACAFLFLVISIVSSVRFFHSELYLTIYIDSLYWKLWRFKLLYLHLKHAFNRCVDVWTPTSENVSTLAVNVDLRINKILMMHCFWSERSFE